MATIGFGVCLAVSILVLLYMASKSYENINTYYWTLMMLIPTIILGYWIKSRITTSEGAMVSLCYIYLDSTVLLMVMAFSMMASLGIKIRPGIKIASYTVASAHMVMIWGCMNNQLYYKSITVALTQNGSVTKMVGGPLKFLHLIYLGVMLLLIAGILLMGFTRKGTYSRRTLNMYAAVSAAGIVLYVIESVLDLSFSTLPYLYVAGEVMIALDYDHAHVHDISCLISEQQKYYGTRGYVAMDLKRRFLSCNLKVYDFLPELKQQIVDAKLPEGSQTAGIFLPALDAFLNEGQTSQKFRLGEMTCVSEVSRFSIRKDGKPQGYLFDIRDATEEQKVLDVMNAYNETLNAEVAAKTASIAAMQQKIVIGMANLIENRDNNTGGHVRRTSDVVHILVEEIVREGKFDGSQEFAQDIIRAAPMHDLGKISIDTSILCKPGRLTDDEYRLMKQHSLKSGEMVEILLDGVEAGHFVHTAFNIARYHHERWDGHGYPDGLAGTNIPIEARIMAVADVYDALVSKRCYKEPMSFDEAAKIMHDGMGSQFDPNLEPIFLACREKLEAYYRSNAERS